MRGRGRERGWVLVGLAVVVVTGCVPNAAAPARTPSGYTAAAAKTTGAANGSVGTAQLLCQAGADGRAFFPYLSIAVSDAEDQLGSVTTTFGSIEPPNDPSSEQLRHQVTDLLARAGDDVSAARIAIRHGDLTSLPPVCEALAKDAQDLQQVPP